MHKHLHIICCVLIGALAVSGVVTPSTYARAHLTKSVRSPDAKPQRPIEPPRPLAPVQVPALTGLWWQVPQANGAIEGYADKVSALPGESVSLRISSVGGASYLVRVLRLDASANDASGVSSSQPHAGLQQPGATVDAGTGEIRAPWSVTDTIAIGSGWRSGYYVVQFVLTSGPMVGTASWTPLIVRRSPNKPPARVLVEIPISTWQAYNTWGGMSAYSGGPWSDVVSFDRPYAAACSAGSIHLSDISPARVWMLRTRPTSTPTTIRRRSGATGW